ncbi:glycosyltransferase [Eggerthella guodeyinii]|uniref:Glycosyltransferase n=1 Tax=Eggerthella guodeyinii TaxID=2690837 RepID=A0A6L7IS60_9ACTN|nr:glycosyltransferase [Eggerthella guodeyinii]QOS67042.1 glycosyltransferase [Eggerthella guodeyinii]
MSKGVSRKKALFVVNSLAGGGAERTCVYLANVMAQDADVDIVTLYEDASMPELAGVHIESLGLGRDVGKAAKLSQLFAARKKLDAFVSRREQEGRYDLVTAHLTASHVLTSFSRVAERCLYVHHSLPFAIHQLYPMPLLRYLRRIYRHGQSVSVSDGVRRQVVELFGADPSNVTTIYNAVPCEHIREKMHEDIPFEKEFLLCVGRLASSKRFDRMVRAFAEGGFDERFDLVFLGEGPLKGDLMNLAESLGVGASVYFPGYTENPYAWMNRSSAMIMTSDREALPTVLIEGLMAGTRVVSADCDFGPREILTGEFAAYLVQPDSIGDYIEAIKGALESYPSPSAELFRRYDADEVVRQYFARYEALVRADTEVE